MPQIFFIAGIACLSLALLFNLLTSISLPTSPGIDIVRINLQPGSQQLRLGIWGVCEYNTGQVPPCTHLGSGYPVIVRAGDAPLVVTPSWTRGLAIQPFVLILNALALGIACFKHEKGPILAALASLVAAFFTLMAFIINIVLYAQVNHLYGEAVKGTGFQLTVIPSVAIWLTLVSLLLILFGGGTMFLGHRKNCAADGSSYAMTSKPGILGRLF
ncbi:hypothetical protein FB451DRAFT_638519 [Mycena latifolia]|nr:hypothetical protein FB451DRAFT_638519 [Mycena latifolia]